MSTDDRAGSSKSLHDLQANISKQQQKIAAIKELARQSEHELNRSHSSIEEKAKRLGQRMSSIRSRSSRIAANIGVDTSLPSDTQENLDQQHHHVLANTSTTSTTDSALTAIMPHGLRSSTQQLADDSLNTSSSSTASQKIMLLQNRTAEIKAKYAQEEHTNEQIKRRVTELQERYGAAKRNVSAMGRSLNDLSDLSSYASSSTPERRKSQTDMSGQRLVQTDTAYLKQRLLAVEQPQTDSNIITEHQLEQERKLKQYEDDISQKSNEIQSLQMKLNTLEVDSLEAQRRIEELLDANRTLETMVSELKVEKEEHFGQVCKQELQSPQSNTIGVQTLETGAVEVEVEAEAFDAEQQTQLEEQMEASQVQATDDNTEQKVKIEMARQIQELQQQLSEVQAKNVELQDKLDLQTKMEVSDDSISEKIAALQATIEAQRVQLLERDQSIRKFEESIEEKKIEMNILNVNVQVLEEKLANSMKNKSLLLPQTTSDEGANDSLNEELQQAKQKLEEKNKTQIKLQLKCKQLEKSLEQSDIGKLTATIEELQQKITELEDEKGQWQLTQVEESKGTEEAQQHAVVEAEEKLNAIAMQQVETIRELEQQKQELEKELQLLRQGKELARVESELSEVQREEQLEKLKREHEEKLQEMEKKLTHYVNENMELYEKLDKLSKSSSSAESIEIVERLTQQERAEIDAFNKRLSQQGGSDDGDEAVRDATLALPSALVSELTQTEPQTPYDAAETLAELRDENAELLNKIELFKQERHEVLAKMECLNSENAAHLEKIGKLEQELEEYAKEKEQLSLQVTESSTQQAKLTQELTSLQKSSEVVAALDSSEGATLFDKCERSLSKLSYELEAYRKANDKNSKINVSKKLAKEAKNVHTQLSELLQKVKEASNAVETVTVVETVVAVTAPNGKALAEYEQLTAQNSQLKTALAELQRELEELREGQTAEAEPSRLPAIADETTATQPVIDSAEHAKLQAQIKDYEEQCLNLQSVVEDLREQLREARLANEEQSDQLNRQRNELNELHQQAEDFDRQINDKEMAHEKYIEHNTRLHHELEGKCDTYESELSILQTLVAEQKQQLIEAHSESEHRLNLKLLELQQRDEEIAQLQADLKQQQERSAAAASQDGVLSESLSAECAQLRESLKISKSLAAQQVSELANKQETIEILNQQIIDLYKTMQDNEQIAAFEAKIEAQQQELDTLRRGNEEQKRVVDKLLSELHEQQVSIPQLQSEVQRLTELNKTQEQRSKEKQDKLRKFAASLKKKLEEKLSNEKEQDTSSSNDAPDNKQIDALTARIAELEQALQDANAVSAKLNEDIKQKLHLNLEHKDTIKSLKQQLQAKSAEVIELEEQLENVKVVAPTTVGDAPTPAKELLNEKMAELLRLENVLRDTQDNVTVQEEEIAQLRHELDSQLALRRELQARLESSEQAKLQLTSTLQEQLQELQRQLDSKSTKFEKSKEVIKHRNGTIQSLQRELKELRDKLSRMPEEEESQQDAVNGVRMRYDALKQEHQQLKEHSAKEKQAFEATIARLETLHDGIQAKLQEDMSYIETLEAENNNYKSKLATLEETLDCTRQEHVLRADRLRQLEVELQKYTTQAEQSAKELESCMSTLAAHDESYGHKLRTAQTENTELKETLSMLKADYDALSARHAKLVQDNQLQRELYESQNSSELEQMRAQLAQQTAVLERQRSVYDAKLAAKTTEVDELECELGEHMERVSAEKRAVSEQLEKALEDCTKQMDEIVRLQESQHALEQAKIELEREVSWLRLQQESSQQDQLDLQELRMQALQDKTEIDNLHHQIDALASNHNQELQSLRQQLADLDTLGQNQTDDQVFIETENKRLTDLLAEKQLLIENYERAYRQSTELQRQLVEKNELIAHLQREQQQQPTQLQTSERSNDPATASQLFLEPSQQQQSMASAEPIAAPSMFFDSDQPVPSPFDEIVQPRIAAGQLGVAPTIPAATHAEPVLSTNEPTIEDLQRNVSDLEKYAQDLETKLAARNQLVAEYEERLRECQSAEQQQRQQSAAQLAELQHALEQRDSELRSSLAQTQSAAEATDKRLQELTARQADMEQQLTAREEECKRLQAALEEHERLDALNRQIQPTVAAATGAGTSMPPASAIAPTLDMFFSDSQPDAISFEDLGVQQNEPVIEELITPKSAYLCHPDAAATAAGTSTSYGIDWGVDDDPWASAAAESVAEQQHFVSHTAFGPASIATASQQQDLEAQLREKSLQIEQLQRDFASAEQQKKEFQIKTTKLLKKLKELKAREQTQSSALTAFNDLDMAIQDELRTQVTRLEAELGQARKLYEQQATEKEKFKRTIDTLTAGNERMAEMKEQQDRDVQMYQTRIRELQEKLQRLDDWGGGEAANTAETKETRTTTSDSSEVEMNEELLVAREKLLEQSTEIQDLNNECQELQSMLKEEKLNAAREQDALRGVQQQLNEVQQTLEQERERMRQQLEAVQQELNDLRVHNQELQRRSEELQSANEELLNAKQPTPVPSEFDQQISVERDALRQELSLLKQQLATASQADEYVAQLQEKDSEIMHLQHRIEDLMREDQTEKLVLEILTKNQEIHMLKLQVKQLEEDKIEMENNLSLQLTQNMKAAAEAAKSEEGARAASTEELEAKSRHMQHEVDQLRQQQQQLEQEKSHMEEELRILNNHVLSTLDLEDKLKNSVLELDTKNIEINELRKSLDIARQQQQQQQQEHSLTQSSLQQPSAAQWEALIEQKCVEVAHEWQQYMKQRESEFERLESELRTNIDELNKSAGSSRSGQDTPVSNITATTATTATATATGVQDDAALSEEMFEHMRKALETQEIEIVTLKEQLAIRSAEYARLAAKYDPFKLQQSGNDAVSDIEAKRVELDKALYMLHERDMRCEELTHELIQLLDERDTLQLKLSESLRQVEMLKGLSNYTESAASTPTTAQELTTTTGVDARSVHVMTTSATGTGNGAAPSAPTIGGSSELNQKLSQLQTVDHSKDKVIAENRAQRIREMTELNLNSQSAVTTSVAASSVSSSATTPAHQQTAAPANIYQDLSNRSPSAGIFNWLMGSGSGETHN